jgi:hypothetical protein
MSKPNLKQMTPEQFREYKKNAKRDERARASAEREARRIPEASEFRMPLVRQKLLDHCESETLTTIKSELPENKFTTQDEFVIAAVSNILCGFENQFIQKVVNPHGMLVGGHFPDAVASTTIEHVHRFPKLLDSPTFKNLYDKFLRAVINCDGKYQHAYSTPEFIAEVKDELAGTYTLPIVKLEPEKAPVRPTPGVIKKNDSAAEQQTLQRIRDRHLDPTALRFLVDGQCQKQEKHNGKI